jgi:hypothetical protein
MIADQFCSADADQSTLREMASMMGVVVVFASLFTNIDHAIITAVVLVVPTTTGLRDGVSRAELATKATVVVIFADPAMIVVSRFPLYLGPLDNLIVGFTGVNNEGTSRIIVVSFGAVVVGARVIVDLSLVTLHHDGFFSLSRAADYQFSITSDRVFVTVDKFALSILL